MTATFYKAFFALGVVISLGWTGLADIDTQDRSKFKYGYVIAHKGGSTQARLESRDGNLALGRYDVNLRNGTGQKVTYFADDLGFHTGVSYSSRNGKGSSKTEIALGQKALAAFGNAVRWIFYTGKVQVSSCFSILNLRPLHVPIATEDQKNTTVTARSPTLLFGKKFLQAALNAVTSKPGGYPKLNYTPVPGGFYLTHESVEASKDTTEHPAYVAGLTSRGFSSSQSKYSEGVSQSKANTQTFSPTSENVKNEIKQLHIQSTTPSIKSYTSVPQQGSAFSGARDETTQFSQKDQNVKVSTYATGFDDLSYSKQKSIEKTNFADIDVRIISEVQKHAEQIIMKDLQKGQNFQQQFRGLSQGAFQPSIVTMQPIVVTSDGETGINAIIVTTPLPEVGKLSKNLQSGTINSVKITEKTSDQALEDSGYFRVSLSPSLASSINVSQTPHQSINADPNSVSNNSTLCEFNLCEKDSKQIFSVDLTPKDEEGSTPSVADISDGSGANKVAQTFYPENKLHDERHYVTTIDVQKAISLEMNPNEAGSIQLAQNFPFNKIKPFDQVQYQQTVVQVAAAPIPPQPEIRTPPTQKPYILNTVSTAPGLFDVVPNQNLAVLQGLQYNSGVQERAGGGSLGYENQLAAPPPPVLLTNEAAEQFRQNEDLNEIEKNIQELRQQILSDIDAQHEEEERKQNLVDEERKQYFENLKKVEALKDQNSVSYNANSQADIIQATASPASSVESANNVELVPQGNYVSAPQIQFDTAAQYQPSSQPQYETSRETQYQPAPQSQYAPPPQSYQTEIKDFTHEVVVPQPPAQQIPNLSPPPQQFGSFEPPKVYSVDSNIQQSAPVYTTEKIQLENYVPQIAFESPQFAVPPPPQVEEKTKKVQQVLNGQINTVTLNLATDVIPRTKAPEGKALLFNRVLPLDYTRLLHVKQPVSLFQVPLGSEAVPQVYPLPQQVAIPIPQTYKLIQYPEVPATNTQYHSTLTQKATNKVRVQPLKPSTPDEQEQRAAVQNLLAQPQFHHTYYYPGLPLNNNRLQLRHIRKNQISNSDQVRSQSLIRRGKSLKNLRIEYGFKPPLRPSVEFSEEVKPSIYGPSVQPQ